MFLNFCLSCVVLVQFTPMISFAGSLGPPAREEEGTGGGGGRKHSEINKPYLIGAVSQNRYSSLQV